MTRGTLKHLLMKFRFWQHKHHVIKDNLSQLLVVMNNKKNCAPIFRSTPLFIRVISRGKVLLRPGIFGDYSFSMTDVFITNTVTQYKSLQQLWLYNITNSIWYNNLGTSVTVSGWSKTDRKSITTWSVSSGRLLTSDASTSRPWIPLHTVLANSMIAIFPWNLFKGVVRFLNTCWGYLKAKGALTVHSRAISFTWETGYMIRKI